MKKEIALLSADQLKEKYAGLRREKFNLMFQKATNQLENSARIRQVRRDTARVLTYLNQKSRSA